MRLKEIIRIKKLKLTLVKVKAHSGNKYNDKIDKLAKKGKETPEILWSDPTRPIWFAIPIWNQITIDMSTRDFIKEFHKIEITVDWTNQNRTVNRWSQEITNHKKHSWKMFWNQCRQRSTTTTSIKQAKERNFRIKILSDELPTLKILKKRNPKLYKEETCILCKSKEETTEHLFECISTQEIREEIWKKLLEKLNKKIRLLKKKNPKDNNSSKTESKKLHHLIKSWKPPTEHSGKHWINLCLGLFDENQIKTWKEKTKKEEIKTTEGIKILEFLPNTLLKLVRKKLWIPRCNKIIDWEKNQGITKDKKRKKTIKNGKTQKSTRKKTPHLKNTTTPEDTPIDAEKDQGEKTNKIDQPKKKVKEIIWNWVKEGKRWLGL